VDEPHVEGAPTDDQKNRLEGFLAELMLISRRYRILLNDPGEGVELLDLSTQHVIGLGLDWFTASSDETRITGYVPTDSILDGVWPVDGPDGVTEQRHVQNVFPRRDP
jgi:hypothetical protein